MPDAESRHGKHRPGYQARRQRIRSYVLDRYQTTRPDEFEQAWADAETNEQQRETEK
jgi:hypothetical protein